MNFAEKIFGTVKNPKNTMKSIAEQPMIEEAVLIVGIYAVLTALAGYVQAYKVTFIYEGLGDMPYSMQTITTIFAVASGLIGAFLIWIIGTGIIHLISMVLGGEGKFYPGMLTIVGYSMIPMIFSGIIALGVLSILEPVTITISQKNPTAATELYNNPYIIASSIFGLIMQIWFSIILFFGVQSATGLTQGRSAIVVGIPLAISVLIFIWGIWNRNIL